MGYHHTCTAWYRQGHGWESAFFGSLSIIFLCCTSAICLEALESTEEEFFFNNEDSFFNTHTTVKPSFEEAVEKFCDPRADYSFYKNEQDIFDKMKADEAFFFKEYSKDNVKTQILKELIEQEQTVSKKSRYCNCEDVYCGCCTSFTLLGKERFRGCIEIEYVPRDFAMFMTLTINGHIIITRVLSGRNPLPFCARTRYIPLMSFCIRLYDIHHNPHGLSLCMRLEVTSMRQILFSISFDCIKIDNHRISFMMPTNATTFGVVGLHLGDIDPYVSVNDWTKFHFPLPEITTPPPPTLPTKKHHFLWFK